MTHDMLNLRTNLVLWFTRRNEHWHGRLQERLLWWQSFQMSGLVVL